MRPTLLLFICSSLLLFSCKNDDKKIKPGDKPAAPPPAKVDAYIVKVSSLSDDLTLPGTVLPNEETEIHPEISGRLTSLNVAEGRSIARGAVIGKIYDGDLQAQLQKLNVQLSTARTTAKRYEELVKIDGVSRQEYDIQKLNINTILADMNIVRSNLQRTVIRAPFAGTLGLKNVSPGAYVTPATVIATIRQNSTLKLDFTIPEKYASKIKRGSLIDFTANGIDKVYQARVIATENSIGLADRSLNVRAQVINNDGKILPGAFVNVKTSFDPDPNAIMVPSQAILAQARGKQVALYHNGVAILQNVETGIRDTSMVQILSGLKPGDTIITSGLMSLKPNAKVGIRKVN